jgi:hypothetical protein
LRPKRRLASMRNSSDYSTSRFALLGVGGFVAPRHLAAIQSLVGDLVAACDPKDSVGVLDSYFPDCHFFTEFERFDRHLDKISRGGEPVSHLTVCSPNYLHDAHVRYGMRSGADVICEKPLVLNPWNLDALACKRFWGPDFGFSADGPVFHKSRKSETADFTFPAPGTRLKLPGARNGPMEGPNFFLMRVHQPPNAFMIFNAPE